MTTILSNKVTVNKVEKKFSLKDFVAKAARKLEDSIGDMIVTVAVTGLTLAYMVQVTPTVYVNTIPGFYLAGMMVQLFIRIVRRFDESYTNDEIGERIVELEQSINERLDEIVRNYDSIDN